LASSLHCSALRCLAVDGSRAGNGATDDTKKNNRRRGGQRAVEVSRSVPPPNKAGLLKPGKAAALSPGTFPRGVPGLRCQENLTTENDVTNANADASERYEDWARDPVEEIKARIHWINEILKQLQSKHQHQRRPSTG
jgi:hypothetical protein